ncbi:MAG: hypothetical protein WAO91_07255 [Candidatus Nitrosotenuis sp.]
MALKAAIIITGIAIGLLALYGADVAVDKASDQGFLPFDDQTRGISLGGTAMALPIIGFFISRSQPSKTLAIMLFVTGVMVIVGGAVFLTNIPSGQAGGRNPITGAGPLLGIGALHIVLGAIKFKNSK